MLRPRSWRGSGHFCKNQPNHQNCKNHWFPRIFSPAGARGLCRAVVQALWHRKQFGDEPDTFLINSEPVRWPRTPQSAPLFKDEQPPVQSQDRSIFAKMKLQPHHFPTPVPSRSKAAGRLFSVEIENSARNQQCNMYNTTT